MTARHADDAIFVVSDSCFAAADAQDHAELDSVFARWQANNHDLGLTGALMYCDGFFVHVLEGAIAAVHAMVARVDADPRHANMRILREHVCVRRRFTGWPLVYVGPSRWLRRALANRTIADMVPNSPAEADFLVELILSFVGDAPQADGWRDIARAA